MQVLKPNSTGAFVKKWQQFLRGQGYLLDATASFDDTTEKATRAFQKKYQLEVDGKVGNQTFGQAALLGFELVKFIDAEPSFPALPDFKPLTGAAQRQKRFGPLEFMPAPTAKNPEAIRITNDWETKNLVSIVVPQIIGIPGAPASGKLRAHRLIAKQLLALWAEWENKKLLKFVLRFDGLYNPRFIRGGAAKQILSNHAFATAFDINAEWNAMGAEPATTGNEGCLFELVPTAHQFGFYWGGHFSRRDGMHFEVARVVG